LASATLFLDSVPRRAVDRALNSGVLIFSEATISELAEVLRRPKFDRYVSRKERETFLAQLGSTAELIPIIQLIRECCDPEDDKFLEVALNGEADAIITGDTDLLAMNRWRDVAILSPTAYLES
jgi:uncharacterized protein